MGWGCAGRLVVAILVLHIHYILAQQKCGLVPSKVYLAKGEKRQLVFWTDQDYSQAITVTAQPTTTTGSTSTTTEAEVDSFLQAVNGQLPGFGSNKGEEGPFQFGNSNKTDANDATIVNAESVFFNASNEAIENTNNTSISSELIEPLNITFENENEVEGADSGISFPNDISNMINTEATEDNDIDDTNNGSADEPITAANVIEVEADAWEDIPNNEIPIQVDNWPSVQAVISEEEQTTSNVMKNNSDVTTEAPESDINVTDGNTEETESDHPVTAANVLEIEENAWKQPFEPTPGDNWPSPPVDAIIAEEELTTINDLNKSVEAITNIPDTSNDAQNDDNKVPDEPVLSVDIKNGQNILKEGSQDEEMATTSSEQSIKKVGQETTTQSGDVNQRDGSDTTIVAVDINQETKQETTTGMSDEITTINTIVVKETTTLYEEINQRVGQETTSSLDEVNPRVEEETTTEVTTESDKFYIRVEKETTTDSETFNPRDGPETTTKQEQFNSRDAKETTTFSPIDGPETTTESEQFNPRDGQQTTTDQEIFNPRDGTETTTEQEQFNQRDGQETTRDPEKFDPRDGPEPTTESEQFNVRDGQETTTDHETLNPRDGHETTTDQEKFNSRDGPETTTESEQFNPRDGQESTTDQETFNPRDGQETTTDYEADSVEEIVTEEPSTIPILEIGVIEQTMSKQASISFEDEIVGTVQPVNLTNQAASDSSSSNKKIIFINDESIDSTTDYAISNEINDDDPGNDDYHYNFETSTFTIKTNEDSKTEFNESNYIVTDTPIEVTENKVSDTEFQQSSESNNDESEVKIQVVTSMTLKESEQILQDINSNNDKISVVTSMPVQELVKSWDELELFEEVDQADNNNKPIKVAQKLFDDTKHNPNIVTEEPVYEEEYPDEFTKTKQIEEQTLMSIPNFLNNESTTIADASTTSEKNMEELLVESTTVINRNADQSLTEVFEETTLITDFIDTENEFKTVETTDEPTSDTINISTQDDNKFQDSLIEDASILFGLAIPNNDNVSEKSTEATTYFPISDNEIQDDDDDEYSYYDDNFDISPFEEVDSLKIFASTTTGSPGTSKDTSNNEDLSIPVVAAVLAELEESEEIFDETTTGSSISQTNNGLVDSMVNVDESDKFESDKFEIEAVESETESDEIQIEFDETTTGSSVFIPQVEAVIVEEEEEEEEDILEDGSDKQKEFDETTIGDFEIEAIFADTTTGSPLENNELFKQETANDYIHDENYDNDQDIVTTTENDDTKYMTEISTVELITSTPSFLAGETPAFTTASSKINTTASSVDLEQSDSSRIIFPSEDEDTVAIFNFKENIEDEKYIEEAEKTTTIPQVKDDVVKLIEDVLTQKVSEEEATTVRVVIDTNVAEVTRRNIITISSENQTSSFTESGVISKQPGHTESEIVQVEAGNVNGPLSLDEVIYYDDADGNEDDSEIDTANSNIFVDENAEDKPFVEKVEDLETTDELTTEINGFVVNKKQIVKTLSNNDIETVRTSGDTESVNINISKDNNTVENKSDTTIKPTDSNEDVKNVETTTTFGDSVQNFKQAPVEITIAPALDDKELVTDKTEKLSTKNPHVVIDVVDNVLKLEKEDVIIEANASTEANILNTTLVAQNDTTTEKDKKPATFPVTELLNGIYKLIQGYIPTRAEIDPSIETLQTDSKVDNTKYPNNIEYFDSPNAEPIYNVHNAPRDTTPFTTRKTINNIEDSVDFANSNTDPFQQLSAPDLTGLIPETEREDNVQYIFASQVKKSPAITLSPFNSDALKVQEPPKVLFDKTQESIDTEDEEQESSFSSLTKVIQQPFKVFLPSFLTSPKIKTKSDKVQVAGSLPVTVRDPSNSQRMQMVRRPIQKPDATKSRFPILGSLFSSLSTNSPKKQVHKPRRPLRPDVPAQQPIQTGFVPIPTRQRSSPVSIPLPGTVDTDQQSSESQFSPKIGRLAREEPVFEAADRIDKKILSFIQSRPIPMRDALLKPRSLDQELERRRREAEEPVNCTWTIQTEKNLYLLVTFHNLSAPFTVDCEGAYIEVERENNGFEARWCGNRVTQGGSRPHVIFARNEVRITVFDDGLEGKNLPTGFNADVEVIDLFDAGEFSSLRKTKGYSSVREVAGRSIL